MKQTDKECFPEGFFDFYSYERRNREHVFIIKEDLFFANYGGFLREFYQTIDEDLFGQTEIHPEDNSLKLKDMDSFTKVFDHYARNGTAPIITTNFDVSILGCASEVSWLFYCGSYKAYLEEYSTLIHFERILVKAMENPLAKAVKSVYMVDAPRSRKLPPPALVSSNSETATWH